MRITSLPVSLSALALFAAAPTASAQISPCPPQGLTLAMSGGTLGSQAVIAVSGMPGAVALLGIDIAGGPIPLPPFGTFCLGFTGALGMFTLPLGPGGHATLSATVTLDASLVGVTIYSQAVAVDPTQPGGLALSNGGSFELRPPRYYLIEPGSIGPFPGPPGRFSAFQSTTLTFFPVTTLAGNVLDAERVPALGRIAMVHTNWILQSLDEDTGAQVQAISLPTSPGSPLSLAPAPKPDELLVLYGGLPPTPFGGGFPGALRRVSLAGAGSVVETIPLAAGNPSEIVSEPGSPIVWLPAGNTLLSVDLTTHQELAPIPLPAGFGPVVHWIAEGGRLYALHGGVPPSVWVPVGTPGAITAIDVATHAVMGSSAPFTLGDFPTVMRLGPGTIAKSLHVLFPAAQLVVQYHPDTLAPVASASLPASATMMELSSGGTEWILIGSGDSGVLGGAVTPGTWMRLPIGAPSAQFVTSLPADFLASLSVLPSKLLHTAMLTTGGGGLIYMATDPSAGFVQLPTPLGPNSGVLVVTN